MVTLARVVLAVLALSVAASAQQKPASVQQKPDFSGRWVAVSPEKAVGREQIVKHDDKSLAVELVSARGSRRLVYQLDGVERRIAMSASASDITMLANARWDGSRVVITTNTSYPNGMKTMAKDTWSIDAQGRLVVDFAESGPTGPGPSMKTIYVRKK